LCSVKFNGANIGICQNYPLASEVSDFKTCVIEVLPFNNFQNFCNTSFLFDSTGALECKSPRVKITKFFQNFYGVHFDCYPLPERENQIICQLDYSEKNMQHCATILYDGALRLNLESAQFVENYVLPSVIDVKLQQIQIPSRCLMLYGKKNSDTYLKLISFADDYKVLYDGFVKDFKISDSKLYLTEGFNDHMGHCLEKILSLSGSALKTESIKKLYTKGKSLENIPIEILPYVFLESVKSSFIEEEKALLSENLRSAGIQYFTSYFCEIYDIMQNPKTLKPCVIKKISENYFTAADYSFEFLENKICNIMQE